MTDAPSGPPVQLLTRRDRARRRLGIVVAVTVVTVFAVSLTLVALRSATKPNSGVRLGSTTFKVGSAASLAKVIEADDFPLLFQDLQNGSIDIYVNHVSDNHLTGWRALEAHAPDKPRSCQLQWKRTHFEDPCDGVTFPADGSGLRRYKVNVVKGVLYVNFRDVIEPEA